MEPRLAVVELKVKDWANAVEWFRVHLHLQTKLENPDEQYALFHAGDVELAIKGQVEVILSNKILPQWEVEDVEALQHQFEVASVRIVKPMKTSKEGYRRIIVEGPERIELLFFDWRG